MENKLQGGMLVRSSKECALGQDAFQAAYDNNSNNFPQPQEG